MSKQTNEKLSRALWLTGMDFGAAARRAHAKVDAVRNVAASGQFADFVEERLKEERVSARAIIGSKLKDLAQRLVELADSEKEDVARRVCLDLLEHFSVTAQPDEDSDHADSFEEIIRRQRQTRGLE